MDREKVDQLDWEREGMECMPADTYWRSVNRLRAENNVLASKRSAKS